MFGLTDTPFFDIHTILPSSLSKVKDTFDRFVLNRPFLEELVKGRMVYSKEETIPIIKIKKQKVLLML